MKCDCLYYIIHQTQACDVWYIIRVCDMISNAVSCISIFWHGTQIFVILYFRHTISKSDWVYSHPLVLEQQMLHCLIADRQENYVLLIHPTRHSLRRYSIPWGNRRRTLVDPCLLSRFAFGLLLFCLLSPLCLFYSPFGHMHLKALGLVFFFCSAYWVLWVCSTVLLHTWTPRL